LFLILYHFLKFCSSSFTRTSNFCSHQALVNNKFQSKDENKIVEHFGGLKRNENFIKPAEKFVENWGVIRWPRHGCGGRSYALIGFFCLFVFFKINFLKEHLLI